MSSFVLPSLVNIGASYDFHLSSDSAAIENANVLTLAAAFTSNSFTRDQWRGGLQYAMRTKKRTSTCEVDWYTKNQFLMQTFQQLP